MPEEVPVMRTVSSWGETGVSGVGRGTIWQIDKREAGLTRRLLNVKDVLCTLLLHKGQKIRKKSMGGGARETNTTKIGTSLGDKGAAQCLCLKPKGT